MHVRGHESSTASLLRPKALETDNQSQGALRQADPGLREPPPSTPPMQSLEAPKPAIGRFEAGRIYI